MCLKAHLVKSFFVKNQSDTKRYIHEIILKVTKFTTQTSIHVY